MLPSPLTSPYSLSSQGLEPLPGARPKFGTMPVANAPSTATVAPERWACRKHAVNVAGGPALNVSTRTDSSVAPSRIVRLTYDAGGPSVAHSPVIELTVTGSAPRLGCDGSQLSRAAGLNPPMGLIAWVSVIVCGTPTRPA